MTPFLPRLRRGLLALVLLATAAPVLAAPPAPCAGCAGHADHAAGAPHAPSPADAAGEPGGDLWDWLFGAYCPDCNRRVGGVLGGDRCGCDEPGGSGRAPRDAQAGPWSARA